MGNLASGHFKPTNKIQEQHNDRTLSPSYLIPQEFRGQNEVNRYSTQARGLRDKIIENAINIYENTKKKNAPKFKAKSYQWSLVVNIKINTTMSDLEKLAEHFEIKYGFQCYQIAIHRDEGYMDENNQPHINHHAHMEFITLDKNTGKNMMRKAHLSPRKFADMQTEIAQILGMERGTDKRVSGTERIEPRKYAQMKNQERKKLNSEMLSAIYNFLEHIAPNYVSEITEKYKQVEFFAKTFGVVKKLKELYSKIVGKLFGDENAKKDNQDILNAINELQERPTTEQYSQLEQVNSKQAQTIQAKYKEIATLKQERTDLTNKLQEQATETKKSQHRIQTLESNETALKNDLNAKESIIQDKEKELNTLKQERTDLKDKLQAQEKTINELNKKLQELEDNYRQNRERIQAENKRLKEQGLEKIYTQKDYEDLKKAHHQEVEALKKQIQELEKTIKKNNEYTYTKRM
ncbi:mobilization protein [Helicobacter pylori]|uniref:mobilization protein n=1 Tax=Helicobacter pylori TaxID=210 RepID=UPI0027121AD9|nr:mobilization protein [Helicobacter pylori]MDO7812473.1 mobilization protein [Helicobacter pylori]